MAFLKTGIAANVNVVRGPHPLYVTAERKPALGEERAGLVWDGEDWIPKADWQAKTRPRGEATG